MFESKKIILYITKSKITISQVSLGNKPNEKIIGQFEWTPYTLDNVLLKIKMIIGNINIRILLSEDFVYVVDITLPSGVAINKDIVRQKAQEFIPENLTETVWDFKKIIKPSPSIAKSIITIQVVAVVRSLFEQLSKSIAKVGLKVEAIEPLSYALARFTKKQNKPFVFIYIDEEILLTLAQNEVVLATERLKNININVIRQFIAFTKEKFSIDPQNIIFSGNTKNIDLKQYQNANLKFEIQNTNPKISLAYKEDLKGKDEDVLNLGLLKILQKQSMPSNTTPSKKNRFPTVIIAIGFVVAIGFIGSLIIYKNISSPILTLTPLATQSAEIDKSAYTISILNVSGISGEATKIENLLKNNGFNVVETGNAEKSDYEKTEVRYKETVPSELILALDKPLKTLYDFSIGKKLGEKEATDILIIIAKSIKE